MKFIDYLEETISFSEFVLDSPADGVEDESRIENKKNEKNKNYKKLLNPRKWREYLQTVSSIN